VRAGLKVPAVRTYDEAYGFARLWLEKYDGDLRSLRDFPGPNDIQVTQGYYGHHSINVAVECANTRLYPAGTKA
jgi:hypothetical protein